MPKKFDAILFDLDGTLLDTAPDLAMALNYVLEAEKKPPLILSEVREVASDGAAGLLKIGFDITSENADYSRLREKLLNYYHAHIHDYSCLFDGMESILKSCEQKNIPWGIVTNKPGYLTDILLKRLQLQQRASCVVSGDTLKLRKPYPDPLIYAAELLKIMPQKCCYIGDAQRDIEAAKAANMFSIGALYGYIPKEIDPKTWNANAYVNSPKELLDWIF